MTLTNASVPQPQAAPIKTTPAPLPTPQGIQIIARPLSDPDFDALRPVNPMLKLYWANRGHMGGHRVSYRMAQGFRLAKKEDVQDLPEYMVDPTGQIINGDRVLMVISRAAYDGALLHNQNKANQRVNRFGHIEQNYIQMPDGSMMPMGKPVDVVAATLGEVTASPLQQSKIHSFVPDQAQLNALLNQTSTPQKG